MHLFVKNETKCTVNMKLLFRNIYSWKMLIEIDVSLMIDFWIQLVIVDIHSINLIRAWTHFKYFSIIHAKFWFGSASPYFVHFVWTTSILLLCIMKHSRENPEAKWISHFFVAFYANNLFRREENYFSTFCPTFFDSKELIHSFNLVI